MIDKYWVTVSSAPIYKTRGVSVLLASWETESQSTALKLAMFFLHDLGLLTDGNIFSV